MWQSRFPNNLPANRQHLPDYPSEIPGTPRTHRQTHPPGRSAPYANARRLTLPSLSEAGELLARADIAGSVKRRISLALGLSSGPPGSAVSLDCRFRRLAGLKETALP